ncbi:MAG TPA: hydroxyacylglutathione hydrolase [Thioalkalivibrio sp.]|nr:hydroxyacylglutathione hydrolase [Thioalkalivibrio sp.]
MSALDILPVPAFNDNYIWLICDADRRRAAIVDPGDASPVLAVLAREGIEPVALLITHHHGDHVGGVAELKRAFPGLVVYGPARERIAGIDVPLQDGDVVELPAIGAAFEVMDVPGHTAGHIAYYGHGALFCGDTLFAGGCGRVFDGTHDELADSLQRIATLPGDTLLYCAHEYTLDNLGFGKWVEPDNAVLLAREERALALRHDGRPTVPSTLTEELATNPFMRLSEPAVIAAAEAHAGQPLRGAREVFYAIRQWKDREYD